MRIIDGIKKSWNKFWYDSEEKPVKKVTVKDLQKNIVKIQQAMTKTQNEIEAITNQMGSIDRSSECGEMEYSKLALELKTKHELYGVLQHEVEQENKNIKLMKEGKSGGLQAKDVMMIGGLIFIGTFAVALERESPKALKLATFILKLFPIHI